MNGKSRDKNPSISGVVVDPLDVDTAEQLVVVLGVAHFSYISSKNILVKIASGGVG